MLQETIQIIARTKTGSFVVDPTVEVGDYQISLDGGAFANLANLPVVTAGTPVITVTLSATEQAASSAVLQGIDQTPAAQWATNYTPVAPSFSLTGAGAQEIAEATEAALLNDMDATAFLEAVSSNIEAAINNEADGTMTVMALVQAVRDDIERPTGTLATLNQSAGDASQDMQQAIAVVNNKLPADTASQIALIAPMRGTDDAFKNGDNIKVTVDGVERTGLHEKV